MTNSVSSLSFEQKNQLLLSKMEEVKDKQGFIGNIWNGFKEITGFGLSESDAESKLKSFQEGKLTFEEAVKYIEEFDKKQSSAKTLATNILVGVAGIAAATIGAKGSIGWGLAMAKGAPAGALAKTVLNIFDRATNDIEDDAFDTKAIIKDVVSGAVTGTASAISSKEVVKIGKGSTDFQKHMFQMTGASAILGGGGEALNYVTDVALGNKEFDFGEMASSTLISGAVSAGAGAIVGGYMYTPANEVAKQTVKTTAKRIIEDSCSSSARKAIGTAERSIFEL